MKKQITIILLLGLLVGCNKKNVEPDGPDSASIVAGTYKLTKAMVIDNDITSSYGASLLVSRINDSTVKADYTFSKASPFSETWTLKKIANDTIAIKSAYANRYQNGQIHAILADNTLQLYFQKQK